MWFCSHLANDPKTWMHRRTKGDHVCILHACVFELSKAQALSHRQCTCPFATHGCVLSYLKASVWRSRVTQLLPSCRSRRRTHWLSHIMTSPLWRTTIMLLPSEFSSSQSTATYRYHPPAHAIMPHLATIAWSHSQTVLRNICLMHKRKLQCGQTSWAGDL